MVVVASQIPLDGLGARRKGMLHQLDDQKASAANVTKSQRLIQHASGIPSAIQDAWTEAISSPQGPVWLEIPQNVLLDPAHAPGTGTPEAGGITSRELLEIIRGFRGMNLVGADIVEVAPAYDHAEITGVAASHVAYELVTLMADSAVEGNRFGAANGYAAQALGQEARRQAGFAASVPQRVETGVSP